jgi:hypothetical protein
MRRLILIGATLAMLAALGACGGSDPQQDSAGSPSLGVKFDLTVPLGARRTTGINLTPSHQPSGVIALQTVHDGRLTTVGSQRFRKMGDTSFLVIEVTSHGVEMGWAFGEVRSSCAVAFPPGSKWAGGSYGNFTLGPGGSEAAWTLNRDTGTQSASGPAVSDASAESVAASKKHPTETVYCLTITLDP